MTYILQMNEIHAVPERISNPIHKGCTCLFYEMIKPCVTV